MDECEHYTIRGDVAKRLERDPSVNYPFTLGDQERRLEQLKSLLPYMDSRKCKRWDCQHCILEFMEQGCPHDQLAIEAGHSVAAPCLEVINRSKIDTPGAVRINAIEVLICTELKNAEDAKKPSCAPKACFDLNEAPIPETCDEALDNNNSPANSPEQGIAELSSVDKKQAKVLKDPEPESLSSQVPNNDTGNANVSPSTVIIEGDDSDYDLVPGGNKTLVNKIARKYLSVSYLSGEGKKEGYHNGSSPGRQLNKNESKNKKKMQKSVIVPQQVDPKISDATQDASGENMKNGTFDRNIPLNKNCQMAGVRLSPRRASSGKRKNQLNHDQNGVSEATIPDSIEGLQNEAVRISQPKKRRIFDGVAKTRLANADDTQRVESNADQFQRAEQDGNQLQTVELDSLKSKTMPKSLASHKRDKNDSSSLKSKKIQSPVGDSGNSRPIRNKKATSKATIYQLMLGSKLKNKNCSELSITALDKKCPEKSSHVVVDKELVLQDTPILTTTEDVPVPCADHDKLKLSELLPEISRKKLLNLGVSLKRLEVDSPSVSKQQNVNPIGENGTSSLIQSTKSAERGKEEHTLKLGAPQEKNGNIKSSWKELKKLGRKRKVATSKATVINSKNKGDTEQLATLGKELVPRDETTGSPALPSEEALQLLSMVASQCLQFDVLSGSGLDHPIVPVTEEFLNPPTANGLELGYGGCIEVTNPADYFLIESEGDHFKLGPENLPLRPHRMLKVQGVVPIRSVKPGHHQSRKEDCQYQQTNSAIGTTYLL